MNKYQSLDDILAVTKEIAQNLLERNAKKVDEEALWPEEAIRKLQSEIGGLVVPVEYGGLGQGLYAVAKVCEILGSYCASTAICFGMHLVGSAVIAAKATKDQQERYLKPIAEGKHFTTLSLSEPGTGANFYIPQAQLTDSGNSYFKLNGKKSFVTNGGYADSYVVSVVIPDPDAIVGQFSCVIIPESKDIDWNGSWNGMGMKGNSSKSMTFNDFKVPKNDLLGEPGDEIWYVFEVIAPYFITAMSGTYLGIANTAVNDAIEHMKKRTHSHSGSSLANKNILQYKLGELWAMVERTRQLIYSAAIKADNNAPEEQVLLSILSAKAEVADCVVEVTNKAMTLMGGIAYAENGNSGRYLRDARAAHIMAPTTDILRMWTGRLLLDLPVLAD